MKKLLATLLLTFAILTGSNLTFTNSAEAVEIQLNNQIGKTLHVAVLYYNETQGSWYNAFWYNVQPNSFRSLNFPNHNKSHVWIHAHNNERSWGSEKAWTVTTESNKYKVGKERCPDGSNRRQVAYDSYQIGQDGTVRVNFR